MIVKLQKSSGKHGARGERVVAALDVGSSKVACVIAQLTPGGQPEVLGAGHKLCVGVRHGVVAHMSATEQSIGAVVEQAERAAGAQVQAVYVNFGCAGMMADPMAAALDLGGYAVEQADIEQLHAHARNQIDLPGRTVLHAFPTLYCIDRQTAVQNPRHFHAQELAVDLLVVSGDTTPIRNLDTSIRRAHLDVTDIVASPLASGLGCLHEEERESGVALVEIGAGVTTVSVYARGALVGFTVLHAGGFEVIDDIAVTLNTKRLHAERLLSLYGTVSIAASDSRDMLPVAPLSAERSGEMSHITRLQLTQIIRRRLISILELVERSLEELSFWRSGGRQVVLTGGLAQLQGIEPFAAEILQGDRRAAFARKGGLSVRQGLPMGLTGLPHALSGPAFSTLAGLVHFARATPGCIWAETTTARARPVGGPIERMISILRERL